MRITALTLCSMLVACGESDYTLYRNSITDANMRLHVATFNSADGDAYNTENCKLAAELFQGQPEVKTRFWCEKGRFKK